jgi:hypothetical protein
VLVVLRRVLCPPRVSLPRGSLPRGSATDGQAALASVPVVLAATTPATAAADAVPSHLHTPAIEAEHVHQVYDTIAAHWDRTRFDSCGRNSSSNNYICSS